MTQDTGQTRKLTTVKCEKHGLRYNPNTHSGCVRCRKEAGEQIGQGAARTPTGVTRVPEGALLTQAAPSGALPGSKSAILPSLAVALALVAGTGGTFYWAHQQVYERVAPTLGIDPELGMPIEEEFSFNKKIEPPPPKVERGGALSDEEEKVIGQ